MSDKAFPALALEDMRCKLRKCIRACYVCLKESISSARARPCACARFFVLRRVRVRGCARASVSAFASSDQLRAASRRRPPQGAAASEVSLFLSFLRKERNTINSAWPRAVSRKAPWGLSATIALSLVFRLSSLVPRQPRGAPTQLSSMLYWARPRGCLIPRL